MFEAKSGCVQSITYGKVVVPQIQTLHRPDMLILLKVLDKLIHPD